MNTKIKHNENNKKNDVIKLRFKEFKGWVRNINIISFPSLPPIIFKLNNRNERRKVIIKKKIYQE